MTIQKQINELEKRELQTPEKYRDQFKKTDERYQKILIMKKNMMKDIR